MQVSDLQEEMASPSDAHLKKIGMHVSAYIAHVRTQLKQTIPKAIVHCLVRLLCQTNLSMKSNTVQIMICQPFLSTASWRIRTRKDDCLDALLNGGSNLISDLVWSDYG